MLTQEQIAFYHEHGFLHIPQVFTPAETDELSDELDRLVQEWAFTSPGWTGPWRQAYMNPETEQKSKLTAMHDLQFYSSAWVQAVTQPKLTRAMSDLLGPNVELHHSTLHIKPPQTGHPFPMHQDNPFYEHSDGRYVDVLVHLDDTRHENGEIRFLEWLPQTRRACAYHPNAGRTLHAPSTNGHLSVGRDRACSEPNVATWSVSAFILSTVPTLTRPINRAVWSVSATAIREIFRRRGKVGADPA